MTFASTNTLPFFIISKIVRDIPLILLISSNSHLLCERCFSPYFRRVFVYEHLLRAWHLHFFEFRFSPRVALSFIWMPDIYVLLCGRRSNTTMHILMDWTFEPQVGRWVNHPNSSARHIPRFSLSCVGLILF